MITSKECSIYNVMLSFIVFLSLFILPSPAFCESWVPIGPEGGNFIFSMTNPANANEVTAIITSPSPSNVYRSTDAGASWSKIGEIPSSYISDVSAFDFSTLYAITSSRFYRSMDGGVSWTTLSFPQSVGWPYCVCVDPTDSNKVYAAGYFYDYANNQSREYNMVFFKSTDAGLSWSYSSFFAFESFYPYDMAISKSNPNILYISGYRRENSEYFGALFKTVDGGNNWADISMSVDAGRYNFFESVAIDPTDENKVYVGGTYFYRLVRTGARYDEISWERSTNLFNSYAIDIDPVDPSRIYAAGYNSVSVSTNYGQSWRTYSGSIQRAGQHVEVAPADPSSIYVASSSGFYKSSDSGMTWNPSHEGIYGARIAALAAAPSTLIIQNSGLLMAYIKVRTAEWQFVVTPESCGEVCDILINPDNPDTVLVLEGSG